MRSPDFRETFTYAATQLAAFELASPLVSALEELA
ncbi:MAG: hypothetical protein ACI9DF_006081 [Verrucomicrobiales bacterium]|jgi:hypothetical protein